MEEFLKNFEIAALAVFLYMTFFYVVALIKKRNDIVDILWGGGFLLATWLTFCLSGNGDTRQWLLMALVSLWGLRLSGHIFLRNKGKKEDFRYNNWRKQWGKTFIWRTFLQVFMLQGFLLLLIASPVLLVNSYPQSPLNGLDYIGLAVWMFGFFFEAVGDYELSQFVKDKKNKGKILTTGVWAFTRHPNYFGEVTMWWGIFLIALSSRFGGYALISPLLITFLILKVSGIPMLEEKYKGNKAFEAYKERTNAFFPWFPKV